MLIDQVVVNASPLITLFKSQQSQLLPALFREIIVPATVWDEVTTGGKQDIAAQQLPKANWVKRVEVAIAPEILVWSLDAGESTVLSFALQNPTYRAMVDDAAARRCARTLNIATLGTGGMLVLAKRRGLISSISPALQALQDAGLWLSNDLIALLKQQAEEIY